MTGSVLYSRFSGLRGVSFFALADANGLGGHFQFLKLKIPDSSVGHCHAQQTLDGLSGWMREALTGKALAAADTICTTTRSAFKSPVHFDSWYTRLLHSI